MSRDRKGAILFDACFGNDIHLQQVRLTTTAHDRRGSFGHSFKQ
jgi:hypothetical protein